MIFLLGAESSPKSSNKILSNLKNILTPIGKQNTFGEQSIRIEK